MTSNKNTGLNPHLTFLSLEGVYREIQTAGQKSDLALLLLQLRDWIIQNSEFDSRSGESLTLGFTQLCNKLAEYDSVSSPAILKDRLTRISEHSHDAVLILLKHLHRSIEREHIMMPIHSVREIDSKSIQWLSRKTGRNIREKLAGKPYLKAAHRRLTYNTSENRLFKIFAIKLMGLLQGRIDSFVMEGSSSDTGLVSFINAWSRSSEAIEIGSWTRVPPNNTLLQEQNYRRIWDAWQWLQRMDDDIQKDQERILDHWQTVLFWTLLRTLKLDYGVRFIEQPIHCDYDEFSLRSQIEILGLYSFQSNPKETREIKCLYNDGNIVLSIDKQKVTIRVDSAPELDQIVAYLNEQVENSKLTFDEIDRIAELVIHMAIINNQITPVDNLDLPAVKKMNTDTVVDICAIRPEYHSAGKINKVPFRLLRQIWNTPQDETVALDLGLSDAISFHSEAELISMVNVFSGRGQITKGHISEAATSFVTKLADLFSASRQLTYIIPDFIDDFALSDLRRAINFNFNQSQPLPRSIAAVFTWQASDNFEKTLFKDSDCVLILDSATGVLTITPVIGYLSQESSLKQVIPQSKGITWERHPTIILEAEAFSDIAIANIKEDGCSYAEKLYDFLGFDGAREIGSSISFIDDQNRWYTQSDSDHISAEYRIPWSTIQASVSHLSRGSLSIIALGEFGSSIKIDGLPRGVKIRTLQQPIVEGGAVLNQWQSSMKQIPLWRDYLPELSIRIMIEYRPIIVHLVQSTTIIPQKGRSIRIPVPETFALPKGKLHYQFPLIQGTGSQELRYEAFLRSNAFPLTKDAPCKLQMTYTYGAETPYELTFFSDNPEESGFKSVKVEWRELDDMDYSDAPIPGFPPRREWSDFRFFANDKGGTSDLIEWIERELENIKSIQKYGRVVSIIDTEWNESRTGWYCSTEDNVILHQKAFAREMTELPASGTAVSYYKVESYGGRYRGLDITIGEAIPHSCFLTKSLRFPLLTVWNHGRSLSEPDTSPEFREAVLSGTEVAMELESSSTCPESLRRELLFFLSCLHKDSPGEISKKLVEYSDDYNLLKQHYRPIAFAIGNAELEWQQHLLQRTLEWASPIAMEILAIALWRSEGLIFTLTDVQIKTLIKSLYHALELDYPKIKKDLIIYQFLTITKHLELLLALLRARGTEQAGIKDFLHPNNPIIKQLNTIVDRITQKIFESGLKIKTRINMEVDKPDAYRNTPDLLYALRMYLTGDTGANSIQVTSVSDAE